MFATQQKDSVSSFSVRISLRHSSLQGHKMEEFSYQDSYLRIAFNTLVHQWHLERGITSSSVEMVNCASYRAIVDFGEAALPLIFDRLKREGDKPDHWFEALVRITGTDPTRPEDQGDLRAMARNWLMWADENGYA